MCRGTCYTKKAGNIGLVLRRAVAQGLLVMGDDDMDICCSGADAPPKVIIVMHCWPKAVEAQKVHQNC